MRVIDADAMLERNRNSIYDTTDLEEMLKYEPTVDGYLVNMDEMIKEMEYKSFEVSDGESGYYCDRCIELDDVIDILKKYLSHET